MDDDLPKDIDLKEDWLEYHATYSLKDGVFTADRVTRVKMHNVPLDGLGEIPDLPPRHVRRLESPDADLAARAGSGARDADQNAGIAC